MSEIPIWEPWVITLAGGFAVFLCGLWLRRMERKKRKP
jgi:hypothetical protein